MTTSQCTLIVGGSHKDRENQCKNIQSYYSIADIDTLHLGTELSTIGIPIIRLLLQNASRTPVQSERKLITLLRAEALSPEAQHALLKILEEPPKRTIIILAAPFTQQLIPTIISRCSIISLTNQLPTQHEDHLDDFIAALLDHQLTIPQILENASEWGKNEAEAIAHIDQLIITLHLRYRTAASDLKRLSSYPSIIQSFLDCKQALQSHVNTRLCLEQLLFTYLDINNLV